ncbi:hypothetical protein C8Q74DRAFT_1220879 [Fomes fomentarius]|nr:hypothetical protein C8Q74DRAFT_1220879 [Fomes fomentarius]
MPSWPRCHPPHLDCNWVASGRGHGLARTHLNIPVRSLPRRGVGVYLRDHLMVLPTASFEGRTIWGSQDQVWASPLVRCSSSCDALSGIYINASFVSTGNRGTRGSAPVLSVERTCQAGERAVAWAQASPFNTVSDITPSGRAEFPTAVEFGGAARRLRQMMGLSWADPPTDQSLWLRSSACFCRCTSPLFRARPIFKSAPLKCTYARAVLRWCIIPEEQRSRQAPFGTTAWRHMLDACPSWLWALVRSPSSMLARPVCSSLWVHSRRCARAGHRHFVKPLLATYERASRQHRVRIGPSSTDACGSLYLLTTVSLCRSASDGGRIVGQVGTQSLRQIDRQPPSAAPAWTDSLRVHVTLAAPADKSLVLALRLPPIHPLRSLAATQLLQELLNGRHCSGSHDSSHNGVKYAPALRFSLQLYLSPLWRPPATCWYRRTLPQTHTHRGRRATAAVRRNYWEVEHRRNCLVTAIEFLSRAFSCKLPVQATPADLGRPLSYGTYLGGPLAAFAPPDRRTELLKSSQLPTPWKGVLACASVEQLGASRESPRSKEHVGARGY